MIRTFINFTEFYNFVTQNPTLFNSNAHVGEFTRLINEMNSGCSCQRGRFIPAIEHNYKSMGFALTVPIKESMKAALNATQVELQHNGTSFLTF